MIEIKTQKLRDFVQASYEFDCKYGKCQDAQSGQFTGGFYDEIWEFNGKKRTYYFDSGKLFGYEGIE